MKDFIPLLLGNDINTYSLARAFYEAYGKTSQIFCKTSYGVCGNSKICNLEIHQDIDLTEHFMPRLVALAKKNADKSIIILGCGDNYVDVIVRNMHAFPPNVVAPYLEPELMDKLIRKRDFYEMCEQYGLDYPKTFVYTKDMGKNFTLPFDFPVILKPSDSVDYWHNTFATQEKVYKLNSMAEVHKTIQSIYAAGYSGDLIMQDMIPGDDSYLRVMTALSGKDHKTIFTAMGHPLLEEHTPHGVGNTSLIMSDYDEELSAKISHFLEEIGYTGFSQWDMKFDSRDGKIKIFEVNCRQGRNNFYVTGGGLNIAKALCDEFLFDVKNPYQTANHRSLWTVIPMGVAYRFVKERHYVPQLKALVKEGKMTNPLFLKGDLGWKRLQFLLKSHYSHYVKYWKYYR